MATQSCQRHIGGRYTVLLTHTYIRPSIVSTINGLTEITESAPIQCRREQCGEARFFGGHPGKRTKTTGTKKRGRTNSGNVGSCHLSKVLFTMVSSVVVVQQQITLSHITWEDPTGKNVRCTFHWRETWGSKTDLKVRTIVQYCGRKGTTEEY